MLDPAELKLKKDPQEMIWVEEKPLNTLGLISYDPIFKMYLQFHRQEYFSKHPGQALTQEKKEALETQAVALAKEYLQDLEQESILAGKIRLAALNNASALQVVLRIVNERYEFNITNQDILKNEPRAFSIQYLSETFNIKLKVEEADEIIWNNLGPGFSTCVYFYMYIRICCEKTISIDNAILNDHIYDVLKKLERALKENYKNPIMDMELEHIHTMLKLLKPYLSHSHKEFFAKFIDLEQGDRPQGIDYISILEKELKLYHVVKDRLLSVYNKICKSQCESQYQKHLEAIFKSMSENTPEIEESLRHTKLDQVGNLKIWNPSFLLVRRTFKTLFDHLKIMNQVDAILQSMMDYYEKMNKRYAKEGVKIQALVFIFIESVEVSLHKCNDRIESLSGKLLNANQAALKSQELKASKEVQEFKRFQEERLMAWHTECMQERALKEAVQRARDQEILDAVELHKDTAKETALVLEQPLQEFEVSQLMVMYENLKNHFDILENLMSEKNITFKDLEKLIIAASKDVIATEKFKDFNLIKFTASTHFSAYIPNSHKKWVKTENHTQSTLLYQLTPKQMSTLNSWDHSNESHHGGPMSSKAIERAKQGWIRSGITPERIKLAFKAKGFSFDKYKRLKA